MRSFIIILLSLSYLYCQNSIDKALIMWVGDDGSHMSLFDYNTSNSEEFNDADPIGNYPDALGYDSESKILLWTSSTQPFVRGYSFLTNSQVSIAQPGMGVDSDIRGMAYDAESDRLLTVQYYGGISAYDANTDSWELNVGGAVGGDAYGNDKEIVYLGSIYEATYAGPNWYVSETGSNDNDGSEGSPVATIQHAINNASNLDTIRVENGTYNENISWSDKAVIIIGESADGVVIDGQYEDNINANPVINFGFWNDSDGEFFEDTTKITNVTIKNGFSNDRGGGIYFGFGNLVVKNCIIKENQNGGGILARQSYLEIDSCVIEDNISGVGGGIHLQYGSGIIKNTIVRNNITSGSAGGIQIYTGDVDIIGSQVYGNSVNGGVREGGGVDVSHGSTLNILNTVIRHNSANKGSGIFVESGTTVNLTNSNIHDNSGHSQGHIYVNSSIVNIINSISWPNTDFYGNYGTINYSYSLLENISETGQGINTFNEGEGIIDGNPLFNNYDNHDYTLSQNSPCIDAGNPDMDGDGEDYTNDIDDQDPDGTRMDMGAYYFHQQEVYEGPVWYVSVSGSDDNNGSQENPFSTIPHAVDAATEGDTIVVSPGEYFTNFALTKNISIISSDGPNNTFIDGSDYDGSTIRIYDFWLPSNTGRILIDGFTIRNCSSEEDLGAAIVNGAFNTEGYDKVKLKNIIFENNYPHDIYWNGPGEHSIDNIISSSKVRVENNDLTIKNSLINDFRTNYWSGEILNGTVLGNITLYNNWGGSVKNSILMNYIAQGDPGFQIEYSCLPLGPNPNHMATELNNIYEDPLFCNMNEGDFTLYDNSPCVGTGQDGANMGAYGVGCYTSDIELGKVVGVQPNGDVWAFDYMTNNWQQLSMVPVDGTSTKYITYDIKSEKIILITADGSIWSYDFDEDTWTSMVSSGFVNSTGITYDYNSDRTIIVDSDGNIRTFDYNNNEVQTGVALNSSTTGKKLISYAYYSDKTILLDSNGATWSFDFTTSSWELLTDGIGTCPDGTSMTYDYISKRIIAVKPSGETWEFSYNDNIWNLIDNIGNESTGNKYITYDIDNDKTILVDAGNEQTWAYDYPTRDWIYLNTNTSLELPGFSLTVIQDPPSSTWHVSTTGSDNNNGSSESPFETIQAGIDACIEGDTVLVHPGTYTVNTINVEKGIVITSGYELEGDSSFINSTVITGYPSTRAFMFQNTNNQPELKGLTILNSGGVKSYFANPRFEDLVIRENIAPSGDEGAGICLYESHDVFISNVKLVANQGGEPVPRGGAGLSLFISSAEIVNSLIDSNTTLWGDGGGIWANEQSNIIIKNCTISNNTGSEGGGIFIRNSNAMMRHLQIFGNSSSIGGGIRLRDECTVTFDSSSVINNSSNVGGGSYDGGGIYVSGDVIMDFQDLIIQNNHANERGGGLYLASAGTMNLERLLINNNTSNSGGGINVLNNGDVVPSIINCTIVNNTVLDNDDGSAIQWTRGTITNSIIWGNQGGETVIPHPAQNFTDVSYCNIDIDLIGGGAGNINANPRFCASETENFTIANNSPCIGSGQDGANIGAFGVGCVLVYTWHVSNDGSDDNDGSQNSPFATIQHAINQSEDGDTVLVSAGTYVENINFNGKNIVVQGEGRETTIIDGNQSGSVVIFNSGEDSTAVLINFTLTNGVSSEGGGILITNGSSPILDDLIVINNTASVNGGGIAADDQSSLNILGAVVENNVSAVGGGIYARNSELNIHNSYITDNTSSGSGGGGLRVLNTEVVLDSVLFQGNISNSGPGGGLYLEGSETQCEVINCSFLNNFAASDGSAINSEGAGLTIEGSSFLNNVTESGGAIASVVTGFTMTNTLMYNNSGRDGGAIMCNGSNTILTNCTIAGNHDTEVDPGLNSSAILVHSGNESFTILNTIVWNNVINFDDHDGGTLNVSYSDIEGGESGILISNNNTGVLNWGASNINADPLFCDIQNNNFTLYDNSLCIGNGQDGANIGAFGVGCVLVYTWHVSTLGSDENSGSEDYPFATIQHAINVSSDGDTVLVSAGTYVENINYNGKNIVVQGEDRETTIIDGNQSGSVVIFNSGEDSTATLTGFTITNGYTGDEGGGILIDHASPNITNCIITQNYSNQTGGGVFANSYPNNAYAPAIKNCLIINNSAAIEAGGLKFHDAPGMISNCTVLNNTGPNGIMTSYSDVDIINSILFYNTNYEATHESNLNITFSNIEDGWEGVGNISEDPLFCNYENNNFTLFDNSPCIGTGQDGVNMGALDVGCSAPGIIINNINNSYNSYEQITLTWELSDYNPFVGTIEVLLTLDPFQDLELVGSVQYDDVEFIFTDLTNIVSDSAAFIIRAYDELNNVYQDTTNFFAIIDVIPPNVSLTLPAVGDTLLIGDSTTILWSVTDNIAPTNIELFYRANEDWELITQYSDGFSLDSIGSHVWDIPNIPTQNLTLRLIASDAEALTDTSEIDGITIEISYPMVQSMVPEPGNIDFRTNEIHFTLSQALDASTITSDNILVTSLYTPDLQPSLSYVDTSQSIKISFDNNIVSMDSISVTLTEQLTNIYGYGLDGDGDGEGGDSYMAMYNTSMLADYNGDMTITVEDLSQFIINWESNNLTQELGPFIGEMPHVYVEPDGDYNYYDMGAFALMWNWYFSNNTMHFASYEDEGLPIQIKTEHDSIYLDIPTDLLAYQVQIQYTPGSFFIGSSDDKDGLFLAHQEQELGVYTIMAQPDQKQLVIPIEIRGRDASISISYKGITDQGELAGQMTKSLTIENIPDEFVLYSNYPNPFNPTTKIDYGLPKEANVQLSIFDIMGREVCTLVNVIQEPGYKSITWNGTDALGRNVSAGMYFYLLQAGDFRQVNKMILLK